MSAATALSPAVHSLRERLWWQRILSFPVTIFCMLLAIVPLTLRSRLNDPDLWWHLRLGQVMWTRHRIPVADHFSWTAANQHTIPHEWLSELSLYSAYHLSGYSGLMLWMCLASAVLLGLAYGLCCLVSGNPKTSLIAVLSLWLFATVGLAPRPHMIGYSLLLCELLILHMARTRHRGWFWLLAPLFPVWINAHGSFALGLLLAFAALGLSFVNVHTGCVHQEPLDRRRRMHLSGALIVACFALLITPVGFSQVAYPFEAMLHNTGQLDQISEFQPLRITDARAMLLALVLLGLFTIILVRRPRLDLQRMLFALGGVYLAARHERMIFVAGILIAPWLAELLADLWDGYDPAADRPLVNLTVMAFAATVCVLAFPSRASLRHQVEVGNPSGAVAYLEEHPANRRLLNDYLFGGYLIWAAPQTPVFMDGRGDIYEWAGVMSDYARWATLADDPRLLLNKYRVTTCLLVAGSPMVQVLSLLPEWTQVYKDDKSIIFERRTTQPVS